MLVGFLKRKHQHEMVEDVSDRLWALMGTNIHKILEDAADDTHLPEERLFLKINGWTVSGQIDLQKTDEGLAIISDWKFTSVYSITHPKIEWEQQLNMYAHLVEKTKGIKVEKAQVVAILRDWRRSAMRRQKNYPKAAVICIPIPIWPEAQREKYLIDRVSLHQQSMIDHDFHGTLPECTDEERWLRDGKTPIRCKENYCSVSEYCTQWASYQKNNLLTGTK